MDRKIITTPDAPAPIGPYNQAVLAGDTLYISGQICIDAKTGELRKKDIQEETHQVMRNLKAILVASYMGFNHVVKATIFITDMNQFCIRGNGSCHGFKVILFVSRKWNCNFF